MKVWIDGDACPDISDILDLCHHYRTPVCIVCDDSHEFQNIEEVKVVSTGFQSADMYLLNRIQAGDFVITGDYGVATIALAKQCTTLHPNGIFYTKDNIDQLLLQRHIHGKMRRQKIRTPNPKKRRMETRLQFLNQVESVLKEGDCNEDRY